jgi:MOSC domain-containing protein YiiM/GNAT superfamily N-acetyltransferase
VTDAAASIDGRVLHVNVSSGGVPKLPVPEASVGRLGLAGDGHDHDHVHGGPHRAVALFAIEAIERVRADGHDIRPGYVGENLTTSGIELSLLPVGTRLAIGDEVVLELSAPDGPCDVIKHVFVGGKSGRISILVHPSDSRMYARVLGEGRVRPGDPIRVLPPSFDSAALLHAQLDLLDSVERDAWLAMWEAAVSAGLDVRIIDRGELAAAAAPGLPGSIFNRAYGMRQIPIVLPEIEALFRDAGTTGWAVAGAEDPPWPGAIAEEPHGVHVGDVDDVLARAETVSSPESLEIRPVDPDDRRAVDGWIDLFIAGFSIDEPGADAWRRFGPILAGAKAEHQLIASLDGRDVAAAATFLRRRVAWLGGGVVLPEARGRGIQRALIAERARLAADAGCRKVLATADVGSVSAANLELMGLANIWTRALYRLDPAAS